MERMNEIKAKALEHAMHGIEEYSFRRDYELCFYLACLNVYGMYLLGAASKDESKAYIVKAEQLYRVSELNHKAEEKNMRFFHELERLICAYNRTGEGAEEIARRLSRLGF